MTNMNSEREFRKVSLDDFPHLDHNYYRETTRSLEEKGFSYLEDMEDRTWARKNPGLRTCLRVLVGDEGKIQALIYHLCPTGFLKISVFLMPMNRKFIDFETEFTDGFFVITTNTAYPSRKGDVDLLTDPSASLDELLEKHRERVKDYLSANPSVQVWRANNFGEVLDSQQRQHKARKRRKSKRKPRRKSSASAGLLTKICEKRTVILKFVMVLLVGWFMGNFNSNAAFKRFEQGKQLTLEQYKANYEQHKADAMRPPASYWRCLLFGMILAGIVFGGYEAGRKVSNIILGRLVCKHEENGPDTRAAPEPLPSFQKKVLMSRIMGKVLFFLIISVLLGFYYTGKEVERFEAGEQLTIEKYLEDYEQHKAKITRVPDSYVQYVLTGIFLAGVLIGLYELIGKTGESITVLSVEKKLPIKTHMLLSITWMFIGAFLGGLLWILFVLRNFKVKDLQPLLILGLIVVGPLLIVFLLKRLFNVIPVQCPKCGGKGYRTSLKPITYTCRECQHVHTTNFSLGRGR